MRLPDRKFLCLGLAAVLAACGGKSSLEQAAAPAPNGPAADYPIVIGAPYSVMGVAYTPVDTLNYDEVGLSSLDSDGDTAITGAHHTLPLPSYVEVTSLDSGRTILIRLTRRGPMDSTSLIALSPAAAAQLGLNGSAPVRVRRVNPPEFERAMLRRGEAAPERMETPQSLLTVLRRKLPDAGGAVALAAASASPVTTDASAAPASPAEEALALPPLDQVKTPVRVRGTAAEAPATSAQGGQFVVQAGAFSVEGNARRVAARIDGKVDRASGLYVVRTGPFADKAAAKAALAKVIAAGYSGARIYSLQ